MADDVTLPGDGSVVATDEVDGRHYQLVKLVVGGEGEASLLSRDSPQPVVDQAVEQLLARLLARLNAPQGYDATIQRSKVSATIESGTLSSVSSITSLTSLSVLSSMTSVGSLSAEMLVTVPLRTLWAQTVRSRIS